MKTHIALQRSDRFGTTGPGNERYGSGQVRLRSEDDDDIAGSEWNRRLGGQQDRPSQDGGDPKRSTG
jgi:hypothetical protein